MLRYIGLVWSTKNAAQREAIALLRRRSLLADWSVAAEHPGLLVLFTGGSPSAGDKVTLSGQRGVVLGRLFDLPQLDSSPAMSAVSAVSRIQAGAAAEIAASAGRSLINSHWGSYVLFLQDPGTHVVRVLRGPMGSLPCFWTVHQGIRTFFSSIEDCIALQLCQPSINWDCVCAQAVSGDYLNNETAISEISTLVSGECMEIRDHSCRQTLYWNPCTLQSDHVVASVDEAATLIRRTTQLCINSWVSAHDTVLLQLSGGLDSSIVLGCLKQAPSRPRIVAANFWSKGSDDERRFARSMAQKTQTELIELERNGRADLSVFLTCGRTGNPIVHYSAFDSEPRLLALAQDKRATAIFTGEIGDDLFGHSPAPEVLAECLDTCNFRDLVRAVADYAELMRISFWKALRDAQRYRAWQRRTPYWSIYRYKRFLGSGDERCLASEDTLRRYERMQPRFIHPWVREVGSMPLGRTNLVYSLISTTSTWTHSAFAGTAEAMVTMPLASQPLVEAFAQIPSRFHFARAENGAVARAAFRDILSAEVLNRGTAKGSVELWLQALIPQNRPFLEQVLRDGILVRKGILDKQKVGALLSGSVSKSLVGMDELVSQLYIECWLRRWDTPDLRAVA